MGWMIPFVAGWGLGALGTLVAVALARAADGRAPAEGATRTSGGERRCLLS